MVFFVIDDVADYLRLALQETSTANFERSATANKIHPRKGLTYKGESL